MAVNIIEAYRNVCRDMRGLEAYLTVTEARLRFAHRVMMKGKMPSSEMCYVPLDRAITDYNLAVDEHNETVEAYNTIKEAKEQLEKTIALMSSVEQVVILLHTEQGMSLREIADKTNYSYAHIKRVSMEIKNDKVAV